MIQPFLQVGVYGGGSLYDDNPFGLDPNWWNGGDSDGDQDAVDWYAELCRTAVEDIGWRSVLMHALTGNVYKSDRYPLTLLRDFIIRRLPMLERALRPLRAQGARFGVFLSHWLEPVGDVRRPINPDRCLELLKLKRQLVPFFVAGCDWVAIDAVSEQPTVRDRAARHGAESYNGFGVLGEAVPVLPTGSVYRQNWPVMLAGSEWTGDVGSFYDGIVDPGRTWRGVGPDGQRLGATFYVADSATEADVDSFLDRGFAVNCNTGVSDTIQRYCVERQR